MKVKVKLLSHIRLCDPMDCSLPGSSVLGIFQARVLEWVATWRRSFMLNKVIRPWAWCDRCGAITRGRDDRTVHRVSSRGDGGHLHTRKELSQEADWLVPWSCTSQLPELGENRLRLFKPSSLWHTARQPELTETSALTPILSVLIYQIPSSKVARACRIRRCRVRVKPT